MEEINIKVDGMSCQHCVKAIEMEFKDLNLIYSKVEIGSVEVKYDENVTSEDKINDAIVEAGFKVLN